jgi:DNA repair protein RadA/Sms
MRCEMCECVFRGTKCPSCGHWHLGGLREEQVVTLADEDTKEPERIKTGFIDDVLGGGLPRTSAILIGGAPGGGKTTTCLQLCDIIADLKDTNRVAYVGYEQTAGELRATANRLKLKHLDRFLVPKVFGSRSTAVIDTLRNLTPALTIVDSITACVGEDQQAQVSMCKQYKALAVDINSPVILITHMTKDYDFAGPMSLQHWVDILLTVFPDGGQYRAMKTWKNRYGMTKEVRYLMTETGLVQAPPEEDDEDEDMDDD